MILFWVWKESTRDTIISDTLLPVPELRDSLCYRCVWTVTENSLLQWLESMLIALGAWSKLCFFLKLSKYWVEEASQNIWVLLEYILCVNGFQFSLLILMWIKTHKNILLRIIHIPCVILWCLLYFFWMFHGLENFCNGFFSV